MVLLGYRYSRGFSNGDTWIYRRDPIDPFRGSCPSSAKGGIISYNAPIASEAAQGLYDSSYDGKEINGILSHGLGRLVDGEFGLDNFRLDIGYGKGNGWVSWRSENISEHLELIFEFDQVRNFSAVHLYTNNLFSRNVQIFSKAKIFFSIGGQFYNGPTLSFSHAPDKVMENARNVTIDLYQKLAKFVKIRLYFADKRIMLSEVVFDSAPVAFNVTEEETLDPEEKEIVISSNGGVMEVFETIAARKDSDTYVEVVIGVLTAIILLLFIVFVIILILNKRHKLQGSPTLLRNPFSVTINMKDLLMSFSNSAPHPPTTGSTSSRPVSPVSQQAPSTAAGDRTSQISFEEYRSPLVANYYTPNYATLRCSSVVDDSESPPEIPPLPEEEPDVPNITEQDSSPLRYGSLQNTPSLSPKSKMINLGNYFPRVATDPPNRKRYHTTPRDKHRVPPPVVCWNIAPSMGQSYTCKEPELIPIPRYALQHREIFGACHAGEVSLYETNDLEDIIPGVCHLVAVRTTNITNNNAMESLREVRFLAGLSDPNICKVLGVCTAEQPPWTIVEYGEMGDLCQYLQFLVNRNGTVKGDQPLSVDSLIFMATQIASGMKYLESKHVVHKDLATRNCLVGRGYVVKITDVAMCKSQYKKDYAEIGGRPPAPIRWLPWESILLDRHTCSSSVWAFAVTLWEILNFCCERPFGNLSNEKVIENAEHMYYGGELQVLLNKPTLCDPEIYELMCSCWRRDHTDRPTFKQIYLFLKHSNKDYVPSD